MPTYNVLYRLSNNHVLKIAKQRPNGKIQTFVDRDQALFGVVADPLLPDGDQARNLTVVPPGPMDELGYAKIYVPGSNTVRNATQAEIDTWAAIEQDDEKVLDARQAKAFLNDHPQWRKVMKLIFKAINRTRTDAGLQAWTGAQIVNFINNNLSKDD